MYNPNKNDPQKLNKEKIQAGLSKRQIRKIEYECNLLRIDPQNLLYIAGHLFIEGNTSVNTKIIEDTTASVLYTYEDPDDNNYYTT